MVDFRNIVTQGLIIIFIGCTRMLSRFRQNIFLSLVVAGCLIGMDQTIKLHNLHFWSETPIFAMIMLFVMAATLSFFYQNRNLLIFWTILIILLFIQLVHFNYFGAFISPIDITLFFTHYSETVSSFSSLLNIFIVPSFIVVVAFLIVYLMVKKTPQRLKWRYAWFFLFLEFTIPSVYTLSFHYHHGVRDNPNHSLGDYPSMSDTLIESTQKTILYYFLYTLPHQFFIKSTLTQPILSPLPIRIHQPNVNVIFIMGESLTDGHMSSFGYSRTTTPFLDSLKQKNQAVFKWGISGGVSTDISLSSFFNMVVRPDATAQIATGRFNLFKMAKANGFETHFISAQARYYLSVLKINLMPRYIDHYGDSSFFGAGYKENVYDSKLIDYVKTLDLKKPVFLVLHQRGSHFPYSERYPGSYTFFKPNVNADFQHQQIDTYDNSVRYTDDFIDFLVKIVTEKTKRPTYLIFTSDHGESLGENGIYGHNNLQVGTQHMVPIVIMGLSGAKLNFLTKKESEDVNPQYMSHYELSQIVAYLLGYQVTHFSHQAAGYFVDGNSLTGTAGFDQISLTGDGKLADHFQ